MEHQCARSMAAGYVNDTKLAYGSSPVEFGAVVAAGWYRNSDCSNSSICGITRNEETMMRAVTIRAMVSVVACAFALVAVLSQKVASQVGSSRPLVSEAQYEVWQTELSNWGRWGRDDQLGTLNLITPAKRRAAPTLVKEGVPVSLSTNTFFEKMQDVPCPAEWAMTTATDTGATDRVAYPCIHGAAATHIDSLAHTFFRG